MKIEKLEVGQVVYSVERRRMGNTMLHTTDVFTVRITEIDPEKKWVMASWNHNSPRQYFIRSISKWRVKEPKLIHSTLGTSRLATRAEIKEIKEKP